VIELSHATGYPCSACTGRGEYLGTMGRLDSWRCRACGHTLQTLALEFIECDFDDEPTDPYGECFRGRECAAFEAEEAARIQRELK
jgi:hypothetical protein